MPFQLGVCLLFITNQGKWKIKKVLYSNCTSSIVNNHDMIYAYIHAMNFSKTRKFHERDIVGDNSTCFIKKIVKSMKCFRLTHT